MDITEEATLTGAVPEEAVQAESSPEEGPLIRETCPPPWEDAVREFEQYLLDIGVRI